MADYALPSALDPRAMRKRWTALRRLLRGDDGEAQAPVRAEADLSALPKDRLEEVAPPIDRAAAAEALDAALDGGVSLAGPGQSVRFLIGQPFCGHDEIIARWAGERGVRLVPSPRYEAILAGDEHWLAEVPGPEGRWVLPALERCFLRHASGLSLVRRLLERAASGQLGGAVIGCDSWAWAYLQRILPVPQLATLTPQAFDGRGLATLLAPPSPAEGRRPLRIRNARTGACVLPEPAVRASSDFEASNELKQLAARSRGNPGVAWVRWRERLRAEPTSAQAGHRDDKEERADGKGEGDVVWLTDDFEDPALPSDMAEDGALVLHALLIHNGLPAWLLPDLLPMPEGQIASILGRLEALGILEFDGDMRRVAALAYATARQRLRERGYLVDAF
jgi:hypothetical protein